MQLTLTVDTSIQGDLSALQQLANAFNGTKAPASAPAAPAPDKQTAKPPKEAAPEKPKEEAPAQTPAAEVKDDAAALGAMSQERPSIEMWRALAATKGKDDVLSVLNIDGTQYKLSTLPEEHLASTYAALSKLPNKK